MKVFFVTISVIVAMSLLSGGVFWYATEKMSAEEKPSLSSEDDVLSLAGSPRVEKLESSQNVDDQESMTVSEEKPKRSRQVDGDRAQEFEHYIREEMNAQKIPAMSVHIFKQDEVLYEKYFGTSNLEQNISLENDHLFLLASVSKVVTATALLQLYEDGMFSLDDRINDHLPFTVEVPGQTTDITFRMLLTHTSGIADGSALDDQYYYGEDSPVALNFFLENYLVPGKEFYNPTENFHAATPGVGHEYSNVGNALMGLLVQEISGTDFNTYTKENIFVPLGMTNSFWRLDEILQTIVTPYDYEDGQHEVVEQFTFTDYPNGGLRSTGTDMLTFLSALAQAGTSNNYELLKPDTVSAMITPQIPLIDNEVGLHVFLIDAPNGLWGHDGAEQGAATIMAFNAITKVGAIILTNQGEAELDEILTAAYQMGVE